MKLNVIDFEIISLGIKKNGTFNENDIAESDLARLGIGKILDCLASLKDRKLLDLNKDGSFSVTALARHLLWDNKIPINVRILRLLEIKPSSMEEILKLGISLEDAENIIDQLRGKNLVLMSPLRRNEKLIKMYEILPEGIDALEGSHTKYENEAIKLVDEIISHIKPETENLQVIDKLNKLKAMLDWK